MSKKKCECGKTVKECEAGVCDYKQQLLDNFGIKKVAIKKETDTSF